MVWQSAGRLPAASRAITSGSSPKRDCPVSERVEGGVAQQVECERQPVGRRAAPAAGRGERADLARADAEAARVEGAAQRQPDLDVAVPAEVDDRALGREQVERPLEPGGRRAGVHDEVATVGGVGRQREVDAECGRDVGPAGIDVHERDLHRREPAQQARDAAADHAGADDGDPVAEQGRGVPEGVDGGLDRAREHGASGRHVLGHDGHGAGRHHVGGLVRVQAEDRAAAQLRRALLDGADVEVAVLDRRREVALLERRPHRGVLARRHAAAEHQRLGAAADAGAQRAHDHVVPPRLGQRDRPDLPAAGRAQPERMRVLHGPHRTKPPIAFSSWTSRQFTEPAPLLQQDAKCAHGVVEAGLYGALGHSERPSPSIRRTGDLGFRTRCGAPSPRGVRRGLLGASSHTRRP